MNRSLKYLKKIHFNVLLLTKVYNIWDKKHRLVNFHYTRQWCKIWRKMKLSFQNRHEEFNWFSGDHSKTSKICPLMGCIWTKYIISQLTKYRGVMFDSTENWWIIWRRTSLCFQKWDEWFGYFSPEHSKLSKSRIWWDSLIQSRKLMSLKFTGELFALKWKTR